MPRPYSTDLRERVLRAHEAGEGSQRVLAARFGVSVGAVCGWLAETLRVCGWLRRATKGGAVRTRMAGVGVHWAGPTRRCSRHWWPSRTTYRFAERTGAPLLSAAAVCRALARLGLRRKKRHSTRASKRVRMS